MLADTEPEIRESFAVRLGTPQPVGMGRFPFVDSPRLDSSKSLVTRVDIEPNDFPAGIIEFSASSTVTVEEGETVTLTANRTMGAFGAVDVLWYTPLAENKDLSGDRKGAFSFADGDRTDTVTFVVEDDARPELDQNVEFYLSGDAATDGDGKQATVTIAGNDDANGRFGFSSSSIARIVDEPEENPLNLRLIVLRSFSRLEPVVINWGVVAIALGWVNCEHL